MPQNRLCSMLRKPAFLWIAYSLSALACLVMYSARVGFVFVDTALFSGFCLTVFWIGVLNSVALFALYLVRLYRVRRKDNLLFETRAYVIGAGILSAIAALYCVIALVFIIVMGGESAPIAGRMLADYLPWFACAYCGLFLVFVFPKITHRNARRTVATAVCLTIGVSLICAIFPAPAAPRLSMPMVIDTGTEYSVVFTTDTPGTGVVTYSYNGQDYTVYDTDNGRLRGDSIIHSVPVPYEHLDGNSYCIGSAPVADNLSYGGRIGKTAMSQPYAFRAPQGDTFGALVASDWHTHVKDAVRATQSVGEYQAVILLGDGVPGLMYEEEAAAYIVSFGAQVSQGRMPVLYVRGNHETRGPYANKLADALGMDEFYGTAKLGNYNFILLDSGEDKVDSHPEYGGMTDYGTYRRDMVEWLEQLDLTASPRNIVLSHSHKIAIEEELQTRAYERLQALGCKFMLSGHTHTNELFEYNGLQVYLDGGHKNGTYIASRMQLSPDGIRLSANDHKGNSVFDQSIAW